MKIQTSANNKKPKLRKQADSSASIHHPQPQSGGIEGDYILTDDSLKYSIKENSNTKKEAPNSSVCLSSCGGDGILDERVASLLKGRTLTNSIKSKKHAVVGDGTTEQLLKLVKQTPCDEKPGIFVSRQKTKTSGWKESDAVEYDCFVLEFDDGLSQDKQIERLKKSGIPYSILTWSGSKSIHCAIILGEPISKEKMKEWQATLACIFPEADKSVLNSINKLNRVAVEVPPYGQTLLDFKGKVENSTFKIWLEENLPDALTKAIQSEHPYPDVQINLQQYWESHKRSDRIKCPICAKKNKDSNGTNLQITFSNDGRLLFHCFRCCNDKKDQKYLINYFLPAYKKDPNQLIDMLNDEVDGRYKWHETTMNPYVVSEKCKYILLSVDDKELAARLYPKYEQFSRELGLKICERNFKDTIAVIQRKNAVKPTTLGGTRVPLNDGYVIDLKYQKRKIRLKQYVDFHLPLSRKQWLNPGSTPLFNQMRKDHLNKEDNRLFIQALGFALSGEHVRNKQCMLIIKGPPDTGKSTILDFIKLIFSNYSCGLSVTDCLENSNLARLALGKRIAISGEIKLRAKDGTRFRSLLTGEELRVHLFYQGHDNVEHNVFFVAATNEEGWLEDSPENRKRIRVIEWKNPISKKNMDPDFLRKLLKETPGIVAKCLKAHHKIVGQRLPVTKSTDKFMKRAGRNINSVKDWIADEGVKGGRHYWSTQRLYQLFVKERHENMKFTTFSRLLVKEIPTKYRTTRAANTIRKASRGYLINLKHNEG